MQDLRDRVAVVTGGANGIGLGLARRFLEEGMRVMIADVNQAELTRAVAMLRTFGQVTGKVVDVSNRGEMDALAQETLDQFGAVHVLCNNAGVGGFQRFGSTNIRTWEWVLGVNLWGVINGCSAFLPILQKQDQAHIINTASMAAFFNGPYHQPYNVSKAGVVALTEGLAREFAIDSPHISVSVLCPGQVATTISDDERNAPAGHVSRTLSDTDLQHIRDRVARSLEVGKSPEEVAQLCVEAIRDRRIYIFTHPEMLGILRARADHILEGRPGAVPIS
jgi:NAD(P)-dependent dehydrogenase (short-subunit alcohol dehydrogenase family)